MNSNFSVAFNTASLVARVTGYRYRLDHWMDQHKKTIAATDAAAWRSICSDIAAAGYSSVEIWEAHAAPESLAVEKAREWARILAEFGLEAVGYAGSFRPETVRVCEWLGIRTINGSTRLSIDDAAALAARSGVGFNAENHPEKTVGELLERIGGAGHPESLGLCIDTGHLGTQGVDAPAFVKAAFAHIRHVHVKDVRASGAHETTRLGEGITRLTEIIAALKANRYAGTYAWEDEPESRNPLDIAVESRVWIERALAG